ncbi:CFI-box-CTERM domain-containing protein, partial [Chloroflexota bacterium]
VAVTAHFVEALPPPDVPTVTTLAATDISSYAATIHMSYTVGYYTPVEVRFACKRPTDPAWFYTSWVSRTADGNYTEVLTGLVSQSQYQFKTQLRYDSTVIEGTVYQFTTAAGSSTSLTDLLASFGCFIATAAYGTPTAEQIDALREFRDVVLLKNTLGSLFVALYYRLSPPVADFTAGNEVVRTLVRELLVDPIVWIFEATGETRQN